MVEASRKPASQNTTKTSLLSPPAMVMVGEPTLHAAAGLGLASSLSREARIAQLKADIAMASMALKTSPSPAVVAAPQASLGLPDQSQLLAALSRAPSLTRAPAAQPKDRLEALNQILSRSSVQSLPSDIAYLRTGAGSSYLDASSQQLLLKRGALELPQTGSQPALKRFKLI